MKETEMTMTTYQAVMSDECGFEFSANVEASSRDEAREFLNEDHPESSVVRIETEEDTRKREKATYDFALAEYEF
jgi:hypothetical protein